MNYGSLATLYFFREMFNTVFSIKFTNRKFDAYESNANEQLGEYMECQNSEPFEMNNTLL